jgi:hypothetical protein
MQQSSSAFEAGTNGCQHYLVRISSTLVSACLQRHPKHLSLLQWRKQLYSCLIEASEEDVLSFYNHAIKNQVDPLSATLAVASCTLVVLHHRGCAIRREIQSRLLRKHWRRLRLRRKWQPRCRSSGKITSVDPPRC